MNNILISIWLQAWVDGMKHRSSRCPDRTFLDRNIQLFEILLRYVDNVIFSPEAKIIFFPRLLKYIFALDILESECK